MLRDLNAVLRAFARKDLDRANEILAPYKEDADRGLELAKELIEVVSAALSTAADYGLPPRDLLRHYVSQVPDDKRPSFARAADLVLAAHEQTEGARENQHFEDSAELRDFVMAMLNLGTWLTRQTARKVGLTEDHLYDALARLMATE